MKIPCAAILLLSFAPQFYVQSSYADETCTPVDMRAGDGAMAGTSSMTQGNYGLCYAYSAAEMTDAWNRSHLPKPRTAADMASLPHTSPVAIAVESHGATHSEKPLSGGGSTSEALAFIRSNPPCDYKAAFNGGKVKLTKSGTGPVHDLMPAEFSDLGTDGRDQAYLNMLIDAWAKYKLRIKRPLLASPADQESIDAAHGLSCRLNDGTSPLPEGLANDTDAALARVFAEAADNGATQQDFLNAYFKAACAKNRITLAPPMPPLKFDDFKYGKHSDAGVVSSIATQLSATDPQPVAITYCPSILTQPADFKGLPPQPDNCYGTGGAHASVIIGRKPAPDGSCKFLLRNSWGVGCERYKNSGWECDEATGDIWVDSAKLASATLEVVHY